MKPKEFQELLDFISQSGLAEVSIETDQFKLAVKRDATVNQIGISQPYVHHIPQANTPPAAQPQIPADTKTTEQPAAKATEGNYVTIKSPMIGTFYRSSNPDSDSFANVGDSVSKGQTVCIIEAMKLFNEIESDVAGKIVKILVENATPVEYDQPLFLVDPS